MVEQDWTPVSETPAPTANGWTPVHEEHGALSRFYEKTPVGQLQGTLTANLPSASEPGGAMAKQIAVNALDIPAHIAKSAWDATGGEVKAALDAAEKGDHNTALTHIMRLAERVYAPGMGAVHDLWNQMAPDVKSGNYAGALGTATQVPLAMIGEAPGLAADLAESGPVLKAGASGAARGAWEGATHMGTHYGVPVPAPVAGAAMGHLAARLMGIPQEAGTIIGGGAPIIKGAIKGARASIADLMASRVPKAAAAEPIIEGPSGGWAWPSEASPASPAVTVGDLMKAQAATPRGVDLRSMAEYSPEDLAAVAKQMMQRNRAPSALDLNGGPMPPETAARMNALRDELRARQPEPAEAAEPTLEDQLQATLDAIKAKKGKK